MNIIYSRCVQDSERSALDYAIEHKHDELLFVFTNLHFQTEVGQLLRAHKLDQYGKIFYEKQIFTVEEAAGLTDLDLMTDFSVNNETHRKEMMHLFNTTGHRVFVSFCEEDLGSTSDEGSCVSEVFDTIASSTDKLDLIQSLLSEENFDSHDILITSIQNSDCFLALLTEGFFSDVSTTEALAWAYLNSIPIVVCNLKGVENVVSKNLSEHIDAIEESLSEEQWKVLESQGLHSPVVKWALEQLESAATCDFDLSIKSNSIWSLNSRNSQTKRLIKLVQEQRKKLNHN